MSLFSKRMIIRPTLDDVRKYAAFNPQPVMIGANGNGAAVINDITGTVESIMPRLHELSYLHGGRLFAVEFIHHDPVLFTDLSDSVQKSYSRLRGRWNDFKADHPYAAKAITIGAIAGTAGLVGFLFSGCGGNSGGHSNNPVIPINPPPAVDTTPPAAVTDLAALSSPSNPELAELHFTSTGDDGNVGNPSYFRIKYANSPISSESLWNGATDLASVTATKSGGAFYSIPFDVPAGHLCFAIKTYDEVPNESPLSNSPCVDVISKAQHYVDFWLPMTSDFLNYNESVAMIQGENGVNTSYIIQLAAELIKCSGPAWPGTQGDLENALLITTNGIYNPGAGDDELHIAHDPWYFDNDGIGNPGVRLYFEPDGSSINDFNNLPPDAVTNLRSIMREFLIKHVDAHKADYGNLDITHNPTWATWD